MIARTTRRRQPIPFADLAKSEGKPHQISWCATEVAAIKPISTTNKTSPLSVRYMGHGALSVRSSVTGRHYRFNGHGDCMMVDKHDMRLLRCIPDLIVA